MKKYTTLLLMISATFCFAQVDSTSIPFVSYWVKGDVYDFKVSKIKQQWQEGEMIKNESFSYITNFEVIDSTQTSYTIKWQYKTNLSQYNIPDKLLDRFEEYQITEVIYTTTEVGEFIGIENWQEISTMMKAFVNDLADILAEEKEINKEEFNQVMQPLLRIYETKEGIEQLVFKELNFFHFPFGIEYSTTEVIEYEQLLPNMLGGKPIRGDTKLYFKTLDIDNSYCLMVQEMKLNSEDTKHLILGMFKQMGLEDKEMKKAMKNAKFDITDYNEYEYFYYPGIPIRIDTNREIVIDIENEKAKRIEKVIIELIKD